ncbi:MAG TPA: hypothetical protein VI957_00780 [Candidatus Paceibacterota bacterium]
MIQGIHGHFGQTARHALRQIPPHRWENVYSENATVQNQVMSLFDSLDDNARRSVLIAVVTDAPLGKAIQERSPFNQIPLHIWNGAVQTP